MDAKLKNIPTNMLNFGLGVLSQANTLANFSSVQHPFNGELSVVAAAHAAEILLKARIAEEHPLLIFEKLPKKGIEDADKLDFEYLFLTGRTFQFFDLPGRLWATTGLRLQDEVSYSEFGKLRNAIQHFSPYSQGKLTTVTRKFIFGVLDPFLTSCWNVCAIDYYESDEDNVYIMENLVSDEILFNVSGHAVDIIHQHSVDFSQAPVSYQEEMSRRINSPFRPRKSL